MSPEQFIISSIFIKIGLNKGNFYAAEELPAYSMPKATDNTIKDIKISVACLCTKPIFLQIALFLGCSDGRRVRGGDGGRGARSRHQYT